MITTMNLNYRVEHPSKKYFYKKLFIHFKITLMQQKFDHFKNIFFPLTFPLLSRELKSRLSAIRSKF